MIRVVTKRGGRQEEFFTLDNRLEIIGTTDLEFQRELVSMSQPPNFTALTCDHLRDNSLEGW